MRYIIIVLLTVGFQFSYQDSNVKFYQKDAAVEDEVYDILRQKCNVCHKKDNPKKVFTEQNMESYARKINKQVFVWKRMPKGNEIALTSTEKQMLKNWIKSLNK